MSEKRQREGASRMSKKGKESRGVGEGMERQSERREKGGRDKSERRGEVETE